MQKDLQCVLFWPPGWEEWEIGETGLIALSLGWYDAEDYAAQIAGRQPLGT